MDKRIILGLLLCVVCFMFCGCELITPLTDDDRQAIATYSAKVVAKYNTRQKDGMVNIIQSEEDSKANSTVANATATNSTNTTTNAVNTTNTTNANATANAQTAPPVSLANALAISGVTFTYNGFEVKDNYTTNTFYMSPMSGNKYLVMKFNMSNAVGQDMAVDILSLNPKFTVTINNAAKANNEISLMPEDLATFKGNLGANETKELIIIFQLKESDLQNIQSATLKCTVNGSTVDITL